MTPPIGSESSSFPTPLEEVVQEVRRTSWFAGNQFYCDYARHPTYHPDRPDRILGNCNVYAARVAANLAEQHPDLYTPYLAHINNHFTVVAVDDSDAHFITADVHPLSVPRLSQSRADGKPFLLNRQTIRTLLRRQDDLVFSWRAHPSHLTTRGVDPDSYTLHRWLRPETSPVGLLRWPAAHEYLIAHSALRQVIVQAFHPTTAETAPIDQALDALDQLQDVDVTIDTSTENERYLEFRRAVAGLACAATSENRLEQSATLAERLFTEHGPVFAPQLDSTARRHELKIAYGHMAQRADQMGWTALHHGLAATRQFWANHPEPIRRHTRRRGVFTLPLLEIPPVTRQLQRPDSTIAI